VLIQGRAQVGAHTSVFQILEGTCVQFTWSPFRSRPFGIPLPSCCSKCVLPQLATICATVPPADKWKDCKSLLYRCQGCAMWFTREAGQELSFLAPQAQPWIMDVL
jgi:hypothetical protein